MAHDVVIVGAGSAGATLAGRLSEDPGRSVLLLEAGPDHDTAHTPPAIAGLNFFAGLFAPGRMWPSLTARRAAGQPASFYPRGRGAGGSSAINAMLALRGTPDDYDRWEHEYGCSGWSWSSMLDAFRAIEDDLDYGGDALHGRGGPVPLFRIPPNDAAPFDRAVCRAAIALGYPTADDYHAPGATGISRGAFTCRDGRRVSTNDAYLEPARARSNLMVRGDVLVDRIALGGTRAIGVVTAGGEEIEAREVIVSAGAIHSPAILLRSSIGPAVGLPVGQHLVDHAQTAGFEVELVPDARGDDAGLVINSVIRYSSGLVDAGPNDMQLVWFTAVSPTAARIIPCVMRVFSRGEVRLASDDPHVDPDVDFRILSDDRDRVRLNDAVARVLDIVRHDEVQAVATSVTAGLTPIDDLSSPDAIDAWTMAHAADYVHAAGSCAMGKVVDTECRVIGYEGLSVCDASVMPDVPKANTHLTTVAIAHRVAEMHMRR